MKRPTLLFLLLAVLQFSQKLQAQPEISLEETIGMAKSQSPQYKLQQTKKELSLYQYQIYRSSLKPQISLYGNAPVYTKEYAAITQPDGTISYLPVKQNTADIGLSLSQPISLTGGTISLNTDLNRYDDLQAKTYQYNGTPVFVRINQPLFGFNQLKWDRRIEPLKLLESQKTFVLEMENIAQTTTSLYFDVLEAQENIKTSEVNLKNTEENYEIERQRIDLGTTTEDKLLQLQLQLLTNKQNLEKAKYNYQISLLNLKASLGSKDSSELKLKLPEQIPEFPVDLGKALQEALINRPEYTANERRLLEAQRDVANAKATGNQVSITTTYGLNRAGSDLGPIYSSPKEQQTFSIGINVPLVDWGRRKAAYNTAKASQKLAEYNNEIDAINYTQEITILVKNISLLRGNVAVTRTRSEVAGKRYTIANRLFQTGKLSISDLNIAQNENDNAIQEFVSALRSFWNAYYQLRKVTLYDFEKDSPLYQ